MVLCDVGYFQVTVLLGLTLCQYRRLRTKVVMTSAGALDVVTTTVSSFLPSFLTSSGASRDSRRFSG